MKESKEDIPPNSRLFVLHGRNTTKEELQEAFEKFGKIEDVWMVRDRESHDLKGVTYIKFSKMSEAALAVENMNGIVLPSNARPLKVIIANSRDQGSRKDDDMERFLRLFIVVPRDDSENEQTLRDHFSQFGEVESVNILRNRDTNESKGFAYVKFTKIHSTAKALEECDAKYKAVLAKPKEKRDNSGNTSAKPPRDYPSREPPPIAPRYAPGDLCEGYATDKGYTKVSAFVSTQLPQDLAIRLFDLIPGLNFARLSDEVISHRTQKIYLEYDTPEAASFAVDKLNGFEYPVGEPIVLKPELGCVLLRDRKPTMSQAPPSKTYSDRKRDYMGRPPSSSGSTFCTAKLPSVQPFSKDLEGRFRLFVVCQPEAPPTAALKDVFCRFGNLVDVFIVPGKNFGYVSYAEEDSALMAIKVLHGEELCGNRLKVMEAEPPRGGDRKRSRYD